MDIVGHHVVRMSKLHSLSAYSKAHKGAGQSRIPSRRRGGRLDISASVDIVHCRYLAAAIDDRERLVLQYVAATTRGGYTQFQEYNLRVYSEDGPLTSEHAL